MPRFEPGQEVDGRYRLVAKVGAGGMADVWCADDTMLERRVALKFLHERFAEDEQFVDRFEREARSAAGLQHQNIVSVFDRGEWEGTHYIAMEYVQGATLSELIARGLGIGEAVEITRQVLSGAGYAHEHGIVHRDLKPGNVLVDAEGRARVTDFGIARAGASAITQTGSVLGTAHYLSPEQAQGLDVTASSDIYSIGVILYEALTGRIPFEGDSAVTIALKQVSEQPRPPSELNPNVSKALDAIVLRALAKDPRNRFASAAEFAHALDSAEADPSGGGLGDTASYAAVAAAAGAAMAAGAGPEAAMAREQEAAHEGEQGGWMTRRRALIIGAILLLLGGAAAFALTRPETLTVPNVLEKSAAEARRILDDKGFEVDPLLRPNCSDPDEVIEQDPPAGADADEGSTVTITVSAGSQVVVPRVVGKRLGAARKRVEKAQLRLRTRSRFSDQAKPGSVFAVQPREGTQVECQSPVTLLVSKGQNLVDLPDVVGQQEAQARATLERLGFIPDVEEQSSSLPVGQVIAQDPGAGSTLRKGTTVKLIVSSGPETVTVPPVVGQSREDAIANLQSRGFGVTVIKRVTEDESEEDVVIDQAPEAGARLREGDRVTIYVGKFVQPEEPPPTDEEAPKVAP
jgi:beta-lactam-binding protein with PASTA domain/tRNA A-37 threonylcarbamoyl transferase component Bud32